MSIGETTTRFDSSSERSFSGMNIGGRGDAPTCSANTSSTSATNRGSRRRRLS
jgi:hypothetical protein